MRIRILPYKAGSQSAKNLADALGGKRLKLEGSTFRRRDDDLVINWGNSRDAGMHTLNLPNRVALATNKLTAFANMVGRVSIPPFTENRELANEWSQREHYVVVARHKLTGSGGEGIEIFDRGVDIPAAPLYTKYIPKKSEWRIHVMNGQVFDRQRKIRDPNDDREDVNWQVRNHDNGFIFVRGFNPEDYHQQIEEEALKAIRALALDFGAVDVVWNERNAKAYVLEVNTAPGLEGQTLENYANAFRQHYA